MRFNKTVSIIMTLVLATAGFAACGEKQDNTIVTVTEKKPSRFTLCEAKKQDVVKSKTISLKYTQKIEKNHSFSLDNEPILAVYVKKGDEVKEGDLLAEIDMSDIDEKLLQIDELINDYSLEIENTKELKALELDQSERLLERGDISKKAYNERNEEIEERYALEFKKLDDMLEYQNKRRDMYAAEKKKGQIFAAIDGTVSFVKSTYRGQPSNSKVNIVTLVDSNQCAFTSNKVELAELFDFNSVYDVVTEKGNVYQTQFRLSDDGKNIMLEPVEQDFDIEIGTKATLYLELGRVNDILAVDNAAIHKAGDLYYVYYVDENDTRYMKYVQLGFVGDDYSEIVEGVEPGEILVKK